MNDDARIRRTGDGTVGEIARALRCPAGHEDHVARGEAVLDKARQHGLVVGTDADLLRNAAELFHRRAEDRRVGIVDGARAHRAPGATISSPVEMIATRGWRQTSTVGAADRRQHADLARGEALPGAQHRLAPRDVGAGKGDELPGRRRGGGSR